MDREKPIILSLTGEKSHAVTIPLGQGSFALGALGMDAKKYDVLVDHKLPLNWEAFNLLFTPHGKEHQELNPLGDWPRNFYYWGNDARFIPWSEKREIEGFTWSPLQATTADFTKSKIGGLTINADAYNINLKLGNHRAVSLTGNLHHIAVSKTGNIATLSFFPKTEKKNKTNYQLPNFEAFNDITSLDITVAPLGQPFDCESLLQFKNLTSLSLSGNYTNLNCLEQFVDLERLALRYAPNLEQLPALKSWKKLTSFIGWNIEETQGKLLRNELKAIKKERELNYSTVSQLRKLIWFSTEYGIPFAAWEGKNAKTAVKNYKATLKKIKKAKTEKEAKEVLTEFTKVFNDLPQIETTEREDIGEAVYQLRQVASFEIDAKTAMQWFDDVRDY